MIATPLPSTLLHADEARRLTVILAADIAGYSALMGEDEERTVRDLKDHQAIVLPMVIHCGGRIIDTAGDGIFAEFPSVHRAVRCAVALQMTMADRNRDVPPSRRMQFRIGINQADVVSDDNKIYGDGVNVAARLESVCEPGGIAISGIVHEAVANKWGLSWADAGEPPLKNIRHPVRVWRFSGGTLPPHSPEFQVTDAARQAVASLGSGQPAATLELPEVPSIAVLPFSNMSGDKEQDYFADGITEDLITELARFNNLIVIARNSTFQYRDRATDVREIGRQLHVRYVLEGSTRRSGDRVRLTAQLINAIDGSHLWAERYDRKIEDIFSIQDELVETIIPILACQLGHAERARSRAKPEDRWLAHDFYLRAADAFKAFSDDLRAGKMTAARLTQCRDLVQQCLARDAQSARAYALLSGTYTTKWAIHLDDEYLQPATLQTALEHAERAIAIEPSDLIARAQFAHTLSFLQKRDRAYEQYKIAMRLNPHFTDWRFTSVCLGAGHPDEAITMGERLRRADPFAPSISLYFLAMAKYLSGDYAGGIKEFTTIVDTSPKFPLPRRLLAACLAKADRLDEAHVEAELAMAQRPDWTIRGDFVPSVPQLSTEQIDLLVAGMKLAGLPE